ncbi:hypothetical protein BPAE_0006g01070 [Botrytis paeoniae]|uniref:Uncharacterized protein n=1 Tax=Botrytis paeoniae TaxID=278948 RepID=A0A4Z1G8N7_9HELO|nr:hypothetical protein BPAE_0006g01070 [Botrytis paeoniae]
MSYKAQAPVYNTDNGEKPPPSIEDERISPETFYKLAALGLESDSESDSEIEEYEAYQEPYYDYRHEERSRARSRSPEPAYWKSSFKPYRDGNKSQATYGREEYRRPTVPHPDPTEEYRARKRAERAARATQDDEPQPSRYSRRAPSPERQEYRRDREEYRRPHVPDPPRYQYYGPRGRSPSPPPTRPRYQPESSHKSSSSSYSSSSRTRAEKLRKMEEEREDRERIREDLRAKQELKKERLRRYHEENLRAKEGLDHIRLRREEEEEERLKDRLRQRQNGPDERHLSRTKHEPRKSSRYEEPRIYESHSKPSYRDPEYGYDYARKEVRVPEPRKGEKLRVDVPGGGESLLWLRIRIRRRSV